MNFSISLKDKKIVLESSLDSTNLKLISHVINHHKYSIIPVGEIDNLEKAKDFVTISQTEQKVLIFHQKTLSFFIDLASTIKELFDISINNYEIFYVYIKELVARDVTINNDFNEAMQRIQKVHDNKFNDQNTYLDNFKQQYEKQ